MLLHHDLRICFAYCGSALSNISIVTGVKVIIAMWLWTADNEMSSEVAHVLLIDCPSMADVHAESTVALA